MIISILALLVAVLFISLIMFGCGYTVGRATK